MSFRHGKTTGVAVGGVDISRFLNEATANQSMDTAETSHFGSQQKTYISGKDDGTFSVKGMFDSAVGAIDDVSAELEELSLVNGLIPFTLADDYRYTPGSRAQLGRVKVTSWEVASPVGDVVTVSGEFQADGGVKHGQVLAGAVLTATADGASVDTVETNGTALLYGHLLNETDGDLTVTVQHSADQALWVDLTVFDVVAAGEHQGVYVVAQGVERYLRVKTELAGTGSAQAIVSAARS